MKVIQLYNNESQLIKKAARNGREAQHKIYSKYAPKMLSVCRQYIKDVHNAEEVMVGGFFKVFSNLKNFKNEGSFEGWIRKIMIRECISFLRSNKRKNFAADVVQSVPEVSNNINSQLELDYIQSLIDDLPEGYKMVFVLFAVEGYQHHEIAKMLNISEGTSKSQLFKARKILQEKINSSNASEYGTT
ncbi:MAG TPA: RNA polymerase sigma factor [Salinimicrobium sp.]|nr:RNA polymerase sigma factor [Salinimicrobium sp.]